MTTVTSAVVNVGMGGTQGVSLYVSDILLYIAFLTDFHTSFLSFSLNTIINTYQERQFPLDARRIQSLVDYLPYLEDIASLVGCRPPLRKLFTSEPTVWAAVLFGPLAVVQYRLAGPGQLPMDDVRRVVKMMDKVPLGIRCYLAALAVVTKLCWLLLSALVGATGRITDGVIGGLMDADPADDAVHTMKPIGF